jgi:hypothetical protein
MQTAQGGLDISKFLSKGVPYAQRAGRGVGKRFEDALLAEMGGPEAGAILKWLNPIEIEKLATQL